MILAVLSVDIEEFPTSYAGRAEDESAVSVYRHSLAARARQLSLDVVGGVGVVLDRAL
ncbi:hypothetical protein [Haloarcula sp. CBA1130]|uniref:hypothetical protein n=1 Tax=Haloarcula sp. CBA1130 TaxID=1853685 RepID=UPI001CDA538F|nr:hypothetical protein [Haloarcula sp. CBA1130]